MSQNKFSGANAMSANSLRARYWSWPPFVLGAVLLLPSYGLAVTTQPDKSFPMPGPGKTAVVEVTNSGGDESGLDYDLVVDPVITVNIPDRPPVPCRFRLVAVQSGKTIADLNQLHHATEYSYGHEASFSSDLFEMPTGKTWVALTNDGCRKDYVWVGGLGSIGPIVRENLLVPIGAAILQAIGLILIAGGLAVGFARYLRARMRSRSKLVAGERS